jgi:hypothetical protein
MTPYHSTMLELPGIEHRRPARTDGRFDPETVGLFSSIGIKTGTPFTPDQRMKAILTDAVAVGNATARALVFASLEERTKFFPDRQCFTTFIGGRPQFTDSGGRMLDVHAMFHHYATGITPAMSAAKKGHRFRLRRQRA